MTQNEIKAIKDLVVCSYYGRTPDPTKYSNEDVKATVREKIQELAGTYSLYRRNKEDLFEIIQEAYTEVFPKQVESFVGTFAEVRTVPLNQKAQFKVRRGRRRAKQFITDVALSGAYESFRLDSDTFEVGGQAIGGTAYIDFERYRSGEEDISEALDIILEGMTEAIYGKIQRALQASINSTSRPAANKVIANSFDPKEMERLCRVAASYGDSAVIYACPEFVAEMGPDAIGMPVYGTYALPATPAPGSAPGYATPVYNPRNIEEIAQYGRIKTFRGTPIIEIPQSYTDETNETTVVNPQYAYIFPNGREKPVKVVFEGDMQLDEWQHRDRSFEIEAYQRVGVAILTDNDWCIYRNTGITYNG